MRHESLIYVARTSLVALLLLSVQNREGVAAGVAAGVEEGAGAGFMSLTGSQLEFAVSCSLKAPSNVARMSSI